MDPGVGFRSGRAAVARRADLAAAPKAKRGKLNIRHSANDKFAEFRQLPLHIIVLTDGPSKLWFDYIKSHIEWPEIVQVYDLLSIEASEIVKQDICPGTLVILAPTQLKGELQECRTEARRFLHEADKILQHPLNQLRQQFLASFLRRGGPQRV